MMSPRKWLVVFCVGLCLVTAPKITTAQDARTRAEIQTLINDAEAEIRYLNRLYNIVSDKLSDWEQDIQQTAATPLIDNQQGLQSQAAQTLALQIADHQLVPNAGSWCQDTFEALLIPNTAINERELRTCADSIKLRVPHLGRVDCGRLDWEAGPDGVLRLVGHVEAAAEITDLEKRYGAETVAGVTELPYPGCEALATLELPLTSENRPRIRMLENSSDVAFGESLAFEVLTPDFYSFMYVIYLQADGSVVNLMPRRALFRAQENPRSTLRFGDGREGRQLYTAQAPAGNEAIIAIGARSPIEKLDQLEDPRDGQYRRYNSRTVDRSVFLEILRESMDDELSEAGGRREISADVLPLTVRP